MTTMLQILNKYGRNRPYTHWDGTFGIEIETETRQAYDIPRFTFWEIHADDSLRDFGREYVLSRPVSHAELKSALAEFKEKTTGIPFIQDSITTSVHVHMNFMNETFKTLGNFFTRYALTEGLLVEFVGEMRRCNTFTLPIKRAEQTYLNMINLIRSVSQKHYRDFNLGEDNVKYGALNLSALSKRGSLESRLMRGTTDVDLIEKWVNILNKILVSSREDSTPIEFMEKYRDTGNKLVWDMFGELAGDLQFSRVREEAGKKSTFTSDDSLDEHFVYASSVAYAIKDWKTAGVFPKSKTKKPDVNKLAKKYFAVDTFEALTSDQQVTLYDIMRDENVGDDDVVVEQDPHAGLRIVPTPTRTGFTRTTRAMPPDALEQPPTANLHDWERDI